MEAVKYSVAPQFRQEHYPNNMIAEQIINVVGEISNEFGRRSIFSHEDEEDLVIDRYFRNDKSSLRYYNLLYGSKSNWRLSFIFTGIVPLNIYSPYDTVICDSQGIFNRISERYDGSWEGYELSGSSSEAQGILGVFKMLRSDLKADQ